MRSATVCLEMAAATQQPWMLATLEPGLADTPMLVEKTEIHILM